MVSIKLGFGERQYVCKHHGRSIDGEDLIEEIPLKVLLYIGYTSIVAQKTVLVC